MVFSIYVPATRGFFNIGETMVYTTALLFGPAIGAFAGGVGSMTADILLGYLHYAPATLFIKACEGWIVGVLNRRRPKFSSPFKWKLFTFVFGLIAGGLLGTIGSLYYSGSMELYLGKPYELGGSPILIYVPPEFWYFLGVLVVLLISLMGLVFEPKFGWILLTVIVGGLEMITGYFLYQQFLLPILFPAFQVIAIAEIPINFGQMIVGLIVSIPAVRAVWRALPSLKD